MLSAATQRVSAGSDLTMQEMTDVIDIVMRGAADEEQVGKFLLALRSKGESVAEIAGAAVAMRKHMTPIRTKRADVLDTCGTGGDGSNTFNISTAAALVTAACGVPVAKHGNRSITSRSGSADVLAALGVNIEAPVSQVEHCLNSLGICFCFAPQLHPAMKHVSPIRKKLGVPTVFNMLGPLCNPASAPFQLLGVGKPHLRGLLSSVLSMLGSERSVVVCGEDGLDEVTLSGRTNVTLVEKDQVREFQWEPREFGITEASRDTMAIDGPASSAKIIKSILEGSRGPSRDIVVLNSAAALWTARKFASPVDCAVAAARALDSGAACELLEKLASLSHA